MKNIGQPIYPGELNNDLIAPQAIKYLAKRFNRADYQTKYLYSILGNYEDLIELETAIKYFYGSFCPQDMAETYTILLKYRIWKSLKWIK